MAFTLAVNVSLFLYFFLALKLTYMFLCYIMPDRKYIIHRPSNLYVKSIYREYIIYESVLLVAAGCCSQCFVPAAGSYAIMSSKFKEPRPISSVDDFVWAVSVRTR